MTSDPPAQDRAWSIKKGCTVSVCFKGGCYRGITVSKIKDIFTVYLMDFGYKITARRADLRPLSRSLLDIPPFAYQVSSGKLATVMVLTDCNVKVSLSGVRPSEDGGYSKERVKELITDPSLKFTMEFLGQLEGGRWLVNLQSKADLEDLGSVLVENNFCVSVSDPPTTFPVAGNFNYAKHCFLKTVLAYPTSLRFF